MTTHAQTIHKSRAIDRSPVFYGWVIWAIATVGIIASAPGQAYTVSIFIDHYIADFNLDRTAISTLFGVGTFIAALSLTYVGRQIDKRGGRLVGSVVAISFSVVLVLVSLITGPFTMFISFIAIRFLGQGSMTLVSGNAIAQWWRNRRGWVMGLALVGFALFQAVYIGTLQQLIDNYGWRTTWVILGAAVGAVVVPVWWLFMRDRPEYYGLQPDAKMISPHLDASITDLNHVDNLSHVDDEENWTLKEAMRTPIFWVFLCGRLVSVLWGTGLVFHQVSIITGHGHPEAAVAATYGLLALVNAGVTLGAGLLVNKLRPGHILAAQLTMMTITLILAMHMDQGWMLKVFALTFGAVFALGATFDGNIWADLFGRLHHGEIRGFVFTTLITGTSIGPIVFGFSYDYLGGYTPIYLVGIALACVAFVATFFVNRPRLRLEPSH
jgi:MFS family permease